MTTATQRRKLLSDLTTTEIAYIAGFIDGEGSFTMEPRKHPANGLRCRIPEVVASSVDEEVIDWLHIKCGGSKATKSPKGRLGSKPIYCWTLRGEGAILLTRLLLPELRIERRRRRAEKLASFEGSGWARTPTEAQRFETFAQELFAL